MIDINNFLKQHHNELTIIIFKLDEKFSSHHFIEKFAQRFESDYIEMLVNYQYNGEAFQTVHRLIAKFLSSNMGALHIEKDEKGDSETVFGTIDRIQWWKKI